MSSYATSLTSLRQAVTSRAPEHPPDGAVPAMLAVAMPHTPALGLAGGLPSAMAEMAVVSRHFPMAVTLAGAGATRAATLAALHASVAAALATDPLNPFPRAYVHYGADSTARLPGGLCKTPP